MDIGTLNFMRRGGETLRYHGQQQLTRDPVGHHSYNVAQICRYLGRGLGRETVSRLVLAALDHDVAEWVVGDVPAPAKRALPDYGDESFRTVFGRYEAEVMQKAGMDDTAGELDAEEKKLLKMADALDGMWHCVEEASLGNRSRELKRCFETYASYVAELNLDKWLASIEAAGWPPARKLFNHLQNEWDHYYGKR